MPAPLHIVVLAAGQGSRMKSALPKVLHPLAGQSLLHHVLGAARALRPDGLHVVIGHGADSVRDATPGTDIEWVVQQEQLGTGHAVARALPGIHKSARVLVLYGDVPLTGTATLQRLADAIDSNTLALLTVTLADPTGYGRIIRDERGTVKAIVEEKDADDIQKGIREVNTGILGGPAQRFREWLPALSANNAQGEYYLTDVIALANQQDLAVDVTQPDTPEEVQGVNNRQQLAALERWFQWQRAEELMAGGVTLADPSRVDIRGRTETGQDIFMDVNVVMEGTVTIADEVHIGPNVCLKDCTVGRGARLEANSVVDQARIDSGAIIGPFARIRPDTVVSEDARVGNFVETKKAFIGRGSKVNHLSYIGDTTLEGGVNVGAGTITCNYDGVNKHHTMVAQGAFIGSNTSLVAPVDLGRNSTVGAGSTITRDVGEGELAIARGRQRNIPEWGSSPDDGTDQGE